MKDLQPNVINDYEHLITRAIEKYGAAGDFPNMEAFGLERKELDDYLFEYQSILDSEGSQKAQLTKYGIVAIIPILILSAFPEQMLPWGKYSLAVGIAAGLAIALLLKGIAMLVVRLRLKRLRAGNANLSAYADKVEAYRKTKE